MNNFSENNLKKNIYIQENNEIGIAVINTENWIQPENEDEIIKATTFIASVFTSALLISQSFGKDNFDVIVLLEKFKVKSINYRFAKYLTGILKQLFPDKLRRATLIDPPRYFITAYDIIKTFIDKPTRKKFQLISSKEEKILYEDIIE